MTLSKNIFMIKGMIRAAGLSGGMILMSMAVFAQFDEPVKLVKAENANRIDVFIGNKLLRSFCILIPWKSRYYIPCMLRTASGSPGDFLWLPGPGSPLTIRIIWVCGLRMKA